MASLDTSEAEDAYVDSVMNILSVGVVRVLQVLPSPLRAMVVGGKAANIMLSQKYQIQSTDWDVHAWDQRYVKDRHNPAHQVARDQVGKLLSVSLSSMLKEARLRLVLLEEYYRSKIRRVLYDVRPVTLISSYDYESYYGLGRVYLSTTGFGDIPVVDIMPAPEKGGIPFQGVLFQDMENTIVTLRHMISDKVPKAPKHKRRLTAILQAKKQEGLSCNYYRYYEMLKQLRACAQNTVIGPIDPLVSNVSRVIKQRFRYGQMDYVRQSSYLKTLSASDRKVIEAYTLDKSSLWNLRLLHSTLFKKSKPLPVKIHRLQSIILQAPPLTQDMYVYRGTRFAFLGDHSNYELSKGIEAVPTFLSTSLDNWINLHPFVDPFNACCAFVIRIPKGSRVLMAESASLFPDEREVILPFGSSVHIQRRRHHNITIETFGSLGYQELTTYYATYSQEGGDLNYVDLLSLVPKRGFISPKAQPLLDQVLSLLGV